MMQKYLVSIFGLVWIFMLNGCSPDPNEKANELYVKAAQYLQDMSMEYESYTKAFESYKVAQRHIEQIISKYSSSNIAVSLISGETRISGFTLSEYRKLEESLKPLAEAEQDPLSFALLFVRNVSSRPWILTYIAGKYAEGGQNEKAVELLSQTLEMAKTIDDGKNKATVFANIASKYAKAGRNEQAVQLLSQALDTAKAVGDRDRNASALAEVAIKYAEGGQNEKAVEVLSQALKMAKTVGDKPTKAFVLTGIAGKYAKVGQNEKAVELLSQAFEVIKIDGSDFRLAYIADMYAEAGQFGRALEIAKLIDGTSAKANVLTEVAGKYAEAGQNEKAVELLSQALELANASDEIFKDIALVNVAVKYAEVGQFGRAIEIANAIEDEEFQARAFIYIAGEYADVWGNLGSKDMAMFSEIIHMKYPLKLCWKRSKSKKNVAFSAEHISEKWHEDKNVANSKHLFMNVFL